MDIIPPEFRTSVSLHSPAKTVIELKKRILQYLTDSGNMATPLGRLAMRFTRDARKFHTNVNDLLSDLQEHGLCSVWYCEDLDRTFVFSASNWNQCHQDYKDGVDVWNNLARQLKDVR